MLFPSLRSVACAGTFLALSACSSQAPTNYRGVPLASLSGTVETSSNAPQGSMEAALVWAQIQFVPDQSLVQLISWVGEATPVVGQFPASFTLDVYEPPPPSVLIACPGTSAHIAVGNVVAVPANVDINTGNVTGLILGEARKIMVLYLDTDEPAGFSCLANMGFFFAPTHGFHLMEEVPHSVATRAAGACYPAYVEAPQGLQTPITITLESGTSLPSSGEASNCSSGSTIGGNQIDAGLPDAP